MAESSPPLMLMLPDASGIAAYKLNQFPSAKAAEFFIDSSLRGHAPEGAVMFWALTWQPTADAATEPLVLVRDDDNVVYPFSFSEIESAFEFVQHEMRRGLHLAQVMIYWAVPAHVEVDFWGRSAIAPPQAPVGLTLVTAHGAETGPESAQTAEPTADAGEAAEEDTRFLADEDIADTVRQAEQASSKSSQPDAPEAEGRVVPMPVPGPSSRQSKSKKQASPEVEPIDFPSASQKMQKIRHARAAVNGWGNFALAVDEMLDVYAARQVVTKLPWNRLMRALGQALELDVAAKRKAQEEAESTRQEAIHTATAASKVMCKVWLSAAWTLEEAAYAYALEQRSRAVRGWRFATLGIAEAAEAKNANERALQLAWFNAGRAIGEAQLTYVSRLRMFEEAWGEGAAQIGAAVHVRQRLSRVRTGLNNFSIAVEEAIEAQAYRREMIEAWDVTIEALLAAAGAKEYCDRAIAAWSNVASAMEGVCRANVKKQKKAIRTWGRIARAVRLALRAKGEQDAAIAAWTNISIVLADAAYAKHRHDGLVAAWESASAILAEAVTARAEFEAAIATWDNAMQAVREMVQAFLVRSALMRFWRNAGHAMAEAVPAYLFKQRSIAGWIAAAIAIKQALVTEATLRITQSNLNKAQMAEVEKAVKSRASRRKTTKNTKGSKNGHGKRPVAASAHAEVEVALAPPPLAVSGGKLQEEVLPEGAAAENTIVEALTLLETKFAESLLAAVDAHDLNAEEPTANDEADEASGQEEHTPPLFPSLWRSRAARHWTPREEPFNGFESPPGRF